MAAPIVIGKGTADSGTGLIATPGYPANPQANDIIWLLAVSDQPNGIGIISTSAVGFTQAAQGTFQDDALANRGRVGLWWMRAAGGEGGTINVDRTGDTGANDTSFLAQLYLTRNHIQTGSPYENLAARYGPGGASVVWDAVTVTGASTLVLAFVGQADNLSTVDPPTGYTALATDTTGAGTDSEVRLCYADDSASAPQTSGTGGETEGWGSFHLSAPPIPAQSLTATGLPTEENLGAPRLTFSITPTGIVGGESIGVHEIATTGPGAQPITPTGIPTEESIGAHAVSISIAPTGIPSEESIGISKFDLNISATGIPSDESIGAHTISTTGGAQTITATGIPTEESIGTHSLGINISVTGIPSDESIGVHTFGLNISVTGVPSDESVGAHSLGLNIVPTGISSTESIGAHTIALVTPEPEPEPVAVSGGGPEGRIRRKRHPQVYITSTELEDEEIVAILN